MQNNTDEIDLVALILVPFMGAIALGTSTMSDVVLFIEDATEPARDVCVAVKTAAL